MIQETTTEPNNSLGKSLTECRKAARICQRETVKDALAGLDDARKVAESNGLEIRLSGTKQGQAVHVTFKQGRFLIGQWWPSTERLTIGSIKTTAPDIEAALSQVIEAVNL